MYGRDKYFNKLRYCKIPYLFFILCVFGPFLLYRPKGEKYNSTNGMDHWEEHSFLMDIQMPRGSAAVFFRDQMFNFFPSVN